MFLFLRINLRLPALSLPSFFSFFAVCRAGGLVAAPQAKAPIPNEDEELARRLQEQWLSEDTAGRGGGFGGDDFQVTPFRQAC